MTAPRPLPEGVRRTNGGQRCDMMIGPCSCGATHTLAPTLADRVTNATSDLTLLCDTLAGIGPNPDIDSLTAEDKAEIELNQLATAQSILAVLHLRGYDVKGAVDCLADVVDALDGEIDR